MGFEELQTIWNSQNDENLYTINEEALYARIQQESKSVNHKLNVYEWLMFLGNFIIGIVLFVDAVRENGQPFEYILPALYIAFSLGTLILRRVRRQEEVRFELTVMGELNKAIWQIDYLIKRGRSMMFWYVLPFTFVLTVTLLLNSKPFWAIGMIVILLPLSYFSGRWEINKWYMPQKRELEALREALSNGI